MISALIHVARPADPDAIDRLADTLGALVAGVAAGLELELAVVPFLLPKMPPTTAATTTTTPDLTNRSTSTQRGLWPQANHLGSKS